MDQPLISLCHSTARLPIGWIAAVRDWFDKCDNPENVEHILVTDDPHFRPDSSMLPFKRFTLGLNRKRRCAVDGWNESARLSTGKFLISLSDDLFPPQGWDTQLLIMVPDLERQYVVNVNTGGDHSILTFSMLTRPYFDRLTRDYGYQGGLFYPEYRGMRADNEFTDLAIRDGVVVNARHLYFEHRHPHYGKADMDDTYRHQHADEAYSVGDRVYRRRRRELGLLNDIEKRSNSQFWPLVDDLIG